MSGSYKGLSSIIGAIILVAVTIAVSIAIAAWMGGLTFSFMKTEQLVIINSNWSEDFSYIDLTIKNTGTDSATMSTVQINNDPASFTVVSGSPTINPGDTTVIRIINDYIPNEEVGFYFSAADVVVLPYVSGTGSGIVQIAFGFDKPVIATRVGCLPEVVSDKKTGYLVEPKSGKAIADAVISFYKEGKETEFVANIVREREKFSWATMVDTIESFQ